MFQCTEEFVLDKYNNGFPMENNYATIKKDSKWFALEDEDSKIIGGEVSLEHEDGTLIEISKKNLELHFKEIKDNIITDVRFNNEAATEYDYKHFDVVLDNGELKTFHHHKSNPIPTKEEMIGLTWNQLRALCRKKFYEVVNS